MHQSNDLCIMHPSQDLLLALHVSTVELSHQRYLYLRAKLYTLCNTLELSMDVVDGLQSPMVAGRRPPLYIAYEFS